jgi:hypothetical protein
LKAGLAFAHAWLTPSRAGVGFGAAVGLAFRAVRVGATVLLVVGAADGADGVADGVAEASAAGTGAGAETLGEAADAHAGPAAPASLPPQPLTDDTATTTVKATTTVLPAAIMTRP